jgi:lysophospholipase L1-like esterase
VNAAGVRRSRLVTAMLSLALVSAAIVAGLALVELLSRVLVGTLALHIQTSFASEADVDRRRGMSREDDGVRCTFDTNGFRAEGTPDTFDRTLLFVGDSFTQGYGVADGASFPAQTARALARRGINARAVNAGDSGAGAAQELRLVRQLLGRMKVDLIVVQVFPRNDLDENVEDGGFAVADGRLVEVSPARPPRRVALTQWLAAHEHLLDLNVVRVLGNVFLRGASSAVTDQAVELERLLLRETVITARSAKVSIFLFVVSEQSECTTIRHSRSHDAYDRVAETIHSIGVLWLESCSVTHDPAHYNQSGHFNASGNELIGEALAERLAPLLRDGPLPQTATAAESPSRSP